MATAGDGRACELDVCWIWFDFRVSEVPGFGFAGFSGVQVLGVDFQDLVGIGLQSVEFLCLCGLHEMSSL